MSFFTKEIKLDVPAADTVDNISVIDVIGNKTDPAVSIPAATKSILGYLKGLVQHLNEHSVPHIVSVENTTVNYVDVVNITDKGVLKSILGSYYGYSTSLKTLEVKITIDGSVLFEGSFLLSNNKADSGILNVTGTLSPDFRFQTSLLIEEKVTNAGDKGRCIVAYTTD